MGIAIVASIILGADFHNGTLRNKIILVHNRIDIYLANLLTIMIVSIAFNVIYMFFFFIITMPMFGGFTLSATKMFWIFLNGTFMMLAYASIMTLIAMLCRHSTASTITAFVVLIVAMFVAQFCSNIVDMEEFITHLDINELGEIVEETIRNPQYPSPAKKAFCQF